MLLSHSTLHQTVDTLDEWQSLLSFEVMVTIFCSIDVLRVFLRDASPTSVCLCVCVSVCLCVCIPCSLAVLSILLIA